MEEKNEAPAAPESEIRERAKKEMTPQAGRSVLGKVADFAVSLGKGAAALADRIRGVRNPEEAIKALDAQLEVNRARREPLVARSEKLYGEIAAKKKVYMAAAPVRKKILELELKGMVSEYKSLERQLSVYFENERVLTTVRGRTLELTAMGLRKVSEKEIDRLTDDIEGAAEDAEDVTDAMNDLEKAGKRRVANDSAEFAAILDGFEESALADPAPEAASRQSDDPFPGFGETEKGSGVFE
ncbi:MAG: hypothetical protein K6F50_09420 [Kiritimatiellae bacterium]|nr:hypothetical protein [Kiritimatiellia bacterium]